jgi:uncharacterized membrane protein YdjX (TVP38/TMEM64 family)
MPRLVRKRWLFVLALAILVALLNGGFRFSLFFDLISIKHLIPWVQSAQTSPTLRASFYGFYAVAVMILPITPFPIIGGVLFPFWVALPLNIVATTFGGWLSFRVGRAVGRDAIAPLLRGHLKALDRLAGSKGMRTVLFLRLVGIPPFAVANYGLGLSAVRNRDFVMGTALGMIPWMTLVTYMSTSLWAACLVGGEKGMSSALFKAVAPISAVSLTVVTTVVLTSYIRRRRARRRAHHSNL